MGAGAAGEEGDAKSSGGGGGDDDGDGGDGSTRRTLVVLDLNGVLVDRKPYHTRNSSSSNHGNNGQHDYARRPFCDEFVDFCFRHFDVAVWSCAKKRNMELDLFDGRTVVGVTQQEMPSIGSPCKVGQVGGGIEHALCRSFRVRPRRPQIGWSDRP